MHGHLAAAEVSGAAVMVINTAKKTGALMLCGSFLLKMFCVCIVFSNHKLYNEFSSGRAMCQ